MPTITALYAGLLGLVSMVIAFKAGRLRGKKNIPLGDGGDRELTTSSQWPFTLLVRPWSWRASVMP